MRPIYSLQILFGAFTIVELYRYPDGFGGSAVFLVVFIIGSIYNYVAELI